MSSKKKLSLDDFKVQSFVTSNENVFGALALGAAAIGSHETHTVKSEDKQHDCCSNTRWNNCDVKVASLF